MSKFRSNLRGLHPTGKDVGMDGSVLCSVGEGGSGGSHIKYANRVEIVSNKFVIFPVDEAAVFPQSACHRGSSSGFSLRRVEPRYHFRVFSRRSFEWVPAWRALDGLRPAWVHHGGSMIGWNPASNSEGRRELGGSLGGSRCWAAFR